MLEEKRLCSLLGSLPTGVDDGDGLRQLKLSVCGSVIGNRLGSRRRLGECLPRSKSSKVLSPQMTNTWHSATDHSTQTNLHFQSSLACRLPWTASSPLSCSSTGRQRTTKRSAPRCVVRCIGYSSKRANPPRGCMHGTTARQARTSTALFTGVGCRLRRPARLTSAGRPAQRRSLGA